MSDTPRFAIGEHLFDDLQGVPQGIVRELLVEHRPGYDGDFLADLGRRGTVFPLISLVGVGTDDDPRTIVEEYRGLIGADPVPVIWRGGPAGGTEDILYVVLAVELLEIRPVRTAVGFRATNVEHLLIARWTLLPREVLRLPEVLNLLDDS